jgi:hypothetical protein
MQLLFLAVVDEPEHPMIKNGSRLSHAVCSPIRGMNRIPAMGFGE